ncbi:recombinase family protein [Leucobacter albus]|uniref:Recombinase family protein n=1 Tax=Leucobacter albus TaxID=272210 RepID=A0ABW3TQ82_9MICO
MIASIAKLPETSRRRGIALIRVSKEREGMISPENQRFAIEEYAKREKITIIEWVEGIDESGSRKKSAWWARLDRAVSRIEAKEAELLLVWRIDRTARSRVKWAVATDRVETAGGYIESATEPNDRSPAGRFGRGVLVEHAAFIAESIGETWKETQERRVRHGLTPNGRRQFGYAYSKSDGTYAVDPVEGPKLANMYQAYIAGESAWAIAQRYSTVKVEPEAGKPLPAYARWNTAAVLRVLDSGFGAGFISFRGELHNGAHDPVVNASDWARYKEAREVRRRRPRAERSPYLYSGFIYCRCGGRMGGRVDHGYHRYACTQSIQYPQHRHPDASISAAIIDKAVNAWLSSISGRLNAAAASPTRRLKLVDSPAESLARKLNAATARLDAATLRLVDGVIPQDVYERLRTQLEAEISEIEDELTRVAAQNTVRPVAFVGDLLARWDDLPVEHRRESLRLLIDRVEVNAPDSVPRVTISSALDLT